MMLLLALLVFLGGMTLFGAGPDVVPSSGKGKVLQAPAAPGRASLMIKRVIPTTIVAGAGFRSGEVVRLTGVPVRQVRASAKGAFTIRFRSDPCRSFTITATGSKGSRAAVNFSQFSCPAP